MQIVKKAALLAATVGSLALLGTGTAAAHDTGSEPPTPPVSVQSCSITTGDINLSNGDVTTGDIGDNSPVANNTFVLTLSCFNTTSDDD